MNQITHDQASEYIHIGLPYLDASQSKALSTHLDWCIKCQEYARLQERLAPVLSRTMHLRWDGFLSPASKQNEIISGVRRTAMFRHALRFTNTGILLAVLILGLVAVFVWGHPPTAQPDVASTSLIQTSESGSGLLPLQLASVVCADQAYPAPAGVNLPYPATEVIGGDSVQRDNFTFQIYLYCDDALQPDDPQHFSEIAGLGIFAKWRYDGPNQEGLFLSMYGVEPTLKTSFSGLSKGDYGGISSGLSFPDRSSSEWNVSELAKRGNPIQFSIKAGTEDALYGASLSFKLREGSDGYLPVDIGIKALPIETISP